MGRCSKCGATTPSDARFCMSCGQPLGTACTRCGAALPPEARFCPACGTRVTDFPEATLEDETLKIVTVLFADAVGSTAQAEGMHPEEVRALMTDFFDVMSQEVRAQGGTVERIIGDAVMADFGVPVVHEDDPRRAVKAALRMLERLNEWNAGKEPSHRIQIRIGINTGEVSAAGSVGQDLLVTGDAVNIAARFQEAAWPGTILIGERTAAAVRDFFQIRPIQPLTVKGKAEPLRAFAVEKEVEEARTLAEPRREAPLVGRQEQLSLLNDIFEHIRREGSPRLVTIVGDAGVGKSRLAREFVATLGEDAKVVVGRCLPEGSGTTFWPLAEILKGEAQIFDTDPPAVALEKIAQLVAAAVPPDLVSDPTRVVSALATTIGLEHEDDPLAGLDPREVRRELVVAWRALLTGLATEVPLVVGVDDIYWADATLLEVVEDLAKHVEGSVLLLCLARPDLLRSRPDWGGGLRNYFSLSLDPLSAKESTELVSALVGALPGDLSARVLEKAEGNPFFVEEVVRKLIDEGTIVRDDGGWRATAPSEAVEVPDNVQAVIAARLDLLDPKERQVARLAAVVGRTFWPGAVAHLAQTNHLHDTLRALERREMVAERLSSSLPGEPEYSFKHILIRDVAYESLPRRRRGKAHAATAEWIETKSGQRLQELAEIIAYHYDTAFQLLGDEALRGAARTHCLAAAQSALRRFATQQSEGFGQRAVELSVAGEERVEALEALGDLFSLLSKGDEAWSAYIDAISEVKSSSPVDGEVLGGLAAKAAILPTRWESAMDTALPSGAINDVIETGLEAVGSSDSPARALLLASKAFLQGAGYEPRDEVGEEAARVAVEIAERVGDPNLISAALDATTTWLVFDGRHGANERIIRRRLELVPRLTDITEICDVYGVAAFTYAYIGRYREAVEFATAAADRARGLQLADYLHALRWRIQAGFMVGDWDSALDDQVEIERIHAESGVVPGSEVRAYATAFFLKELRGEKAEADRYAEILKRYHAIRRGVTSPGGLSLAARALAHRGEIEEARSWLDLGRTVYLGAHLEAMCEVVAAQEDWRAATDLIPTARKEAARGELLALPLFIDRLEGRMAVVSQQWDAAESLLRQSADGFAQLDALWEEARSRLSLGEALIASGRAKEAKSWLTPALATFQELGSVQELRRTAELLAQS